MSKHSTIAQDHNEISEDALRTVAGGVAGYVATAMAQPSAPTYSAPSMAVPTFSMPAFTTPIFAQPSPATAQPHLTPKSA
jgi:hypothetical protein